MCALGLLARNSRAGDAGRRRAGEETQRAEDTTHMIPAVFFIYLFIIFVFYKNIFSIWKFTGIYPGRPAAGRPGPGRPAAGRPALVVRLRGDRP